MDAANSDLCNTLIHSDLCFDIRIMIGKKICPLCDYSNTIRSIILDFIGQLARWLSGSNLHQCLLLYRMSSMPGCQAMTDDCWFPMGEIAAHLGVKQDSIYK